MSNQMSYSSAGATAPGPGTVAGWQNYKALFDFIFAQHNADDTILSTATAAATAAALVARDANAAAAFGGLDIAINLTRNYGVNIVGASGQTGSLFAASGSGEAAGGGILIPAAGNITTLRQFTAARFNGPLTGDVTGNVSGSASTVTSAAVSAISDGRATASGTPDTIVHIAAQQMQTTGGQPFLAPATTYDFAGHYPASGYYQWVVLCRDTTTSAGAIQAVYGAGVNTGLAIVPQVTTVGWVPIAQVYLTSGGAAIHQDSSGGANYIVDARVPFGGGVANASGTVATNATIKSSGSSATLNQILTNGVSSNFYAQIYNAGGGVLTLNASTATTGSGVTAVSMLINGEMRVITTPISTPAITIPGSSTAYNIIGDASGAGPGATISLQTVAATSLTPQQAIVGSIVYDTVLGGFVYDAASLGRVAVPTIGSSNFVPLRFYNSWTGGVLTSLLNLCPGSSVIARDFVAPMAGQIQFCAEVTQGGTTAQQGSFLLQINGAGSASTGSGFSERVLTRPAATVSQLESVTGVFNLDTIPVGPGRVTFGLIFSASVYGGATNTSGQSDNLKVQNAWMRGMFHL